MGSSPPNRLRIVLTKDEDKRCCIFEQAFLRLVAILKRMGQIPIRSRSRLFAGIRRLNEYATSFGS